MNRRRIGGEFEYGLLDRDVSEGYTRFTEKTDIPALLGKYLDVDAIEWVARSVGDDKEIREWIVKGTKRG